MCLGKTINCLEFMRIHSCRQIIGEADVERAVGFTCEDVDVEHQNQLGPPPAREKNLRW